MPYSYAYPIKRALAFVEGIPYKNPVGIEAEEALNILARAVHQLKEEHSEMEDERDEAVSEKDELESEAYSAAEDRDEAQSEVSSLEDRIGELEQEIEEKDDRITELEDEEPDCNCAVCEEDKQRR